MAWCLLHPDAFLLRVELALETSYFGLCGSYSYFYLTTSPLYFVTIVKECVGPKEEFCESTSKRTMVRNTNLREVCYFISPSRWQAQDKTIHLRAGYLSLRYMLICLYQWNNKVRLLLIEISLIWQIFWWWEMCSEYRLSSKYIL